jgi:hypothetical protein
LLGHGYVIDLENNTFEVYKGYSKTKLNENDRFVNISTPDDTDYSQIKLVKAYQLSNLPNNEDFINYFEKASEQDLIAYKMPQEFLKKNEHSVEDSMQLEKFKIKSSDENGNQYETGYFAPKSFWDKILEIKV